MTVFLHLVVNGPLGAKANCLKLWIFFGCRHPTTIGMVLKIRLVIDLT